MAKTQITNITSGAIDLPPPYELEVAPGRFVVVEDSIASVTRELGGVANIVGIFTLTSVPDSTPTTATPGNFQNADFLPYLSPINGDDTNDGFALPLPLAVGSTLSVAVFSGTTTTVETAGGIAPLAMTPSDPAIIGKELWLTHALTPVFTLQGSEDDHQPRLITGNSATGFTVSPAFNVPPVLGDTIAVVAPIRTWREHLKRLPTVVGRLSQIAISKETALIQFGAGASFIGVVSPFGAPMPIVRVSGLANLTAGGGPTGSLGRLLVTGGAVREARRAESPTSPTPVTAALTNNNGFFVMSNIVSSSIADIANPDLPLLSGSRASIVAGAPAGQMRVTGLTGMVAGHVNTLLNVSNALPQNNGLWNIVTINSSTSVDVTNALAVIPDAGNGFVQWQAISPDANSGTISWAEYAGLATEMVAGVNNIANAPAALPRIDGVQQATAWVGDYTDELCGAHTTPTSAFNTTATGTTAGVLVVTGGLGLPTATIGIPTTLTPASLPPAGGQLIPGFVGLVAGTQIGRQLLMTTGTAKGTMSKIVAHDATSVTVSPAFSLAIAAGDKCIVTLEGQKVLMVTGPSVGQRRVLTGGLQGNIANVTAIMGGGGLNEATITGLVGMTAADVGASILFRGMSAPANVNNGLFVIATFISATSVTVINAAAAVEAVGTGNWMVVGGVSLGVNAPFAPAPTPNPGLNSVVATLAAGAGAGRIRVGGLVGMTAADVGASITISGALDPLNNGTFVIAAFVAAATVDITNTANTPDGTTVPDGNNGAITVTVKGDQLRIERSGAEIRGAINLNTNFAYVQKAIAWIGNTVNMRGAATGIGVRLLDQGVEYDLRGGNHLSAFQGVLNAPNAGFSGFIGNKNPLSNALTFQACRFHHGGDITLFEATLAQFMVCSNITMLLDRQSHVVGLVSFFGRQVSIGVRPGSQFNISGNGTTRSRIDVSKNTSALVGIIDISGSPLHSGGPVTGDGPMNNVDLLNGSGHAIALNDGSFGNFASVGGTGHAGYGIAGIRNSPYQVRTATTLITGALGQFGMAVDVAASSSVATTAALSGLPAGQVGINNSQGSTIVSSTTTAATSTELTDGVAVYVVNEFRGQVLRYTSGPAAGQQRVIVSNTVTTVTTGGAFNPAPTALGADTYRIETNEPSGCRVEKVTP